MTVQPLLTFINGRADANISVADRALAFGDGVFETLLLSGGQLPFYSLHLDRLFWGLERLHIDLDRAAFEKQIADFLARAGEAGVVKIIVSRGEGRGYAPPAAAQPTTIISLYPPPAADHYARDGVTITVCRQRLSYQPALLGIKHLNRLDNVLAALEIQRQNAVEGLLLDDRETVAEALSRNVFVVKGGTILTPDLRRAGVKGVLRRVIIERLAPRLGLPLQESSLAPQDVLNADEVFLGNSVSGIWPVIKIDTQSFEIGPITQQLQQSVQRLIGVR